MTDALGVQIPIAFRHLLPSSIIDRAPRESHGSTRRIGKVSHAHWRMGAMLVSAASVAGCISPPPKELAIQSGDSVVLFTPGVPKALVYDTTPGVLVPIPPAGWLADQWEKSHAKEIQDLLAATSFDIHQCVSKGITDQFAARGVAVRFVEAHRSTFLNAPLNVSAQARATVLPADRALDAVVFEYGFSSYRDDRVHVTFTATGHLHRHGKVWHSPIVMINPTGIMKHMRNGKILPTPAGLPTWKDRDDLKAHIADAAAALTTVCDTVARALVDELPK